MLKTLSLILPALFPSWRFFKAIEPSPRVEWALLCDTESAPVVWHAFRPRPLTITARQMVSRLFWNPDWNDALFVISCAERIQQSPTDHSINEIRERIQLDIEQMRIDVAGRSLQFRLVFVHRQETELVQEIVYLSDAVPVTRGQIC